MYWYGATASGGLVGIDNFAFSGTVFPITLPVNFGSINATFKNNGMLVSWQSLNETNNSYFEIQASKDGQHFTTIKTIPSKKAIHLNLRAMKLL
ncbi:hypothetical protein [Niabella hibiscisoli]|uniref:hypothetical protein n=1 Tax=Niabella hibiscisoli TaxID=1825928 RepID=UPI001F112FA2|nr:hypothetical protein [Niabella hibiscisoli]MCH5719308.1 hypothetical protein [Niabella hibiscisoli]